MSRPRPVIAVLALCALLAGCGGDDDKGAEGKKTATGTPTRATNASTNSELSTGAKRGLTRCIKVARPKPKGEQDLPEPNVKLDKDKIYEAVMDTSCGRFTITLDTERAPKTAGSFIYLARKGFYDNLTFHRIVPGFVIQGGDPEGTGQGGPGYTVVEPPPSDLRYTKGVVAMAKTEIEDPGTSGSQFYVVTGPDAQLPPDYALAGKVTSGMAAVDRIALVPTNQTSQDPALRDRPISPVVIRSVTITERKK